MNNVFITVLSLSLSGSLLILVLLFCRPLIKNKLSRQWQYYIWLIVIARFLFPVALMGNVTGTIFRGIEDISHGKEMQIVQSNAMDAAVKDTGLEEESLDLSERDMPSENLQGDLSSSLNPHPVQEIFRLFRENYWLIWLMAALLLLIRKITIYRGFVRYVKVGAQPISNMALLDRVAVIGEQIHVSRAVELCVNPLVSSPLLFGILRPCIVIPDADLSDRNFYNTILHELTHYKRGDMFYKWLVQIIICLHWFNPLVYLMGREINKACEFSCDEAVIKRIGPDKGPDYGNTLLESMAAVGHYKESLLSVTLSENKKLLKERLSMIIHFKKKSRLTWWLTIGLTILLLGGFAFTGVYTAAAPDTNRKPYFENQSAQPENAIAVRARTNEWAAADTATGNTAEEVWNNKLQFIEEEWRKRKEPFIIAEGVSEESAANGESLAYLYEHSSIYRNLIAVDNTLYIVPESSFGKVAETENGKIYERYAFYLEDSGELSLTAYYQLDVGKMSVTILSPSGQRVYQNDMTDKFDKRITVQLEQGIHSVILSYDTVAKKCSGEINMMGEIQKHSKKTTGKTVMEMELSKGYDDADPFINERLFFVTKDVDSLDFQTSFLMECESGLLEIADNETKEIIWSKAWKDKADENFKITLSNLKDEKEYVIRLTCTKVKQAKLVMTSDSSLVQERERPRKQIS